MKNILVGFTTRNNPRFGLKFWLLVIGWSLSITAMILIVTTLWRERELLSKAFSLSSFGWLFVSFLCYLLTSLAYVLIWHLVTKAYGGRESYRFTLTALSIASAARYLPGAVWPFLGLVWLSDRIGLTKRSIPALAITSQGLHIALAFWISCTGMVLVAPGANISEWWRTALVVVFSSLLLLILLIAFLRYFQPILKKFNMLSDGKTIQATRNLPLAGLTSLGVWGLNGLRLVILLYAFNLQPDYTHWLFLLAYCIWASSITSIAANLLFFIPLGLGAIELSLLALLGLVVPVTPTLLLIVALNRILQVANDLLFALLAATLEFTTPHPL